MKCSIDISDYEIICIIRKFNFSKKLGATKIISNKILLCWFIQI